MPKKIHIKSIFGEYIQVQEGTIFTRKPFEQWNGWFAGESRRSRPGLRDQYRTAIQELERMIPYIEAMIREGFTYDSHYSGGDSKVIDEFQEECFYEDLEDLRDFLDSTLKTYATRHPIERRIKAAQAMIDHPKTDPNQKAAAENRLAAMKERLEEGER